MKIGLNKGWVIGSFAVLLCAAGIITSVLPKTYVAESVILVPGDVPPKLAVRIAQSSAQELEIERLILSRTLMIEVLWEFENDLTEFRDLRTKDERVANLRKQITVTVGTRVNPMTQQATVSSIKISCRNQSPEMAQRIANRLAELFLEDDYGIMEPPFHLPTDLR